MPSITSAGGSFVQSVIVAFFALAHALDLYTGHLPHWQRSMFSIVYSTCGIVDLPVRMGIVATHLPKRKTRMGISITDFPQLSHGFEATDLLISRDRLTLTWIE